MRAESGDGFVCYARRRPRAAVALPDLPPILSFTLDDGTPVALRPVLPSDRERLAVGFEELSEESRRFRFLGALTRLSPAQLDYFTRIDHVHHVAWGALDLTHPERPGFGVARFVRLRDAPGVAEFSLTVLDTAQGHGLGSLLLAVLYVLAPTVGVRTLRGVVARENGKMTTWLRRLGAEVAEDESSELVFDLPVYTDLGRLPGTARAFRDHVEAVRRRLAEAGLVRS